MNTTTTATSTGATTTIPVPAAMRDDPRYDFDRTNWFRHHLDTPIGPPNTAAARFRLEPGTCVKTSHGFPDMACGIVHDNGAVSGKAVVIGHGWADHPIEIFTWTGTRAEFLSTWQID